MFVAARTSTLELSICSSDFSDAVALVNDDHLIKNSVLILLEDSFSLSLLVVSKESISSTKMIEGASFLDR